MKGRKGLEREINRKDIKKAERAREDRQGMKERVSREERKEKRRSMNTRESDYR